MNKLIGIALLSLSTTLLAQDQVAKEVLTKLRLTTQFYENITIDFTFIFENNSQNINESYQGSLLLYKEKFRLTMNSQTIINDGENQWVYLRDLNEVQIMKHDPDDKMMNPNKIFTIDEEDYKYNYIRVESEKGKRIQIIDLFPKDRGAFTKINIAVNATKNQLERVTLYDRNGGTYTYLVKTFKTNSIIEPFIFNITNFPGVEVIDLR